MQNKLTNITTACALVGLTTIFNAEICIATQTGMTMATQVTTAEGFINGGLLRVGLMAGSAVASIYGMFKHNLMMAGASAGTGIFAFLMKDWINTTFPILM